MSKKNLFLLAAWYLAGWVIVSLYNKKKPWSLKKDLEESKKSGEGSIKVLVDNFLDTHTSLINDLKEELLSDKNKKLIEKHKEDLLLIVDSYKNRAEVLIEELRDKWKSHLISTIENLELLYNEKKSEIDDLKWIAPAKAKELKEKLKLAYEELKLEIKKEKIKK